MKKIFIFIKTSLLRFDANHGFARAGGLAYTSLLALLPIAALSLSFFNIFGVDQEQALKTFLNQILPHHDSEQLSALQNELFVYIDTFVSKFSNQQATLNTMSIVILVLTAIGLLSSIEGALNNVWKTKSKLTFVSRITSFWAVITLGPLLISLSFYFFAKFTSVAADLGFLGHHESSFVILATKAFGYALPVFFSTLALSLLYCILPSTKVPFRSALLGGFVAAVLFELSKIGFGYYVEKSTTYNAIYGVLATIPLFLFWLYLIWAVVLYGAEISWLVTNRNSLIKPNIQLKTLNRKNHLASE